MLRKCWFDKEKCYPGIKALRQYRKKYDEVRRCFSDRPLHDWSSHGADAFRYMCVSLDEEIDIKSRPKQLRAISDYVGEVAEPDIYRNYTPRQTNYLKEDMRWLQ